MRNILKTETWIFIQTKRNTDRDNEENNNIHK